MTASPGIISTNALGSNLSIVPEETQLVKTEYQSLVAEKGLTLPPESALNWSGKGSAFRVRTGE